MTQPLEEFLRRWKTLFRTHPTKPVMSTVTVVKRRSVLPAEDAWFQLS